MLGEPGHARLGKMIPPSTGDRTHGLTLFHAVLHMLTLGRFRKGGSIMSHVYTEKSFEHGVV